MHVRRTHPEAYLLTCTAYGSWLPGDARGSVDDQHNAFESRPAPPDPQRQRMAERVMLHAPVHFTGPIRDLIEATMRDHCRIKGWSLAALNVRATHVHAVVSCGLVEPEVALEQLKSWCTRRARENRLIGPDSPLWTRRGSTRYCWTPEEANEAIHYVLHRQGADLHGKP